MSELLREGKNEKEQKERKNSNRRKATGSLSKPLPESSLRQPRIVTKQKVSPSYKTGEPWKAEFKESLRTQGRIKQAFECNNRRPIDRATAVLETLLNTPPHRCNAANVLCSLTFSAKALGSERLESNAEFRSLVFRVLGVLAELVEKELLTARQLCNAAWAIAKYFDRDSAILPPSAERTALSSDWVTGTAETWSLDADNKTGEQQKRVDKLVDNIAKQLTIMLEESDEKSNDPRYQAKVGEVCMASWAYGVLRPRNRPPGWQTPPQLGSLPGKNRQKGSGFITFEKWTAFSDNGEAQIDSSESDGVTDNLFDAIGGSLCRSLERAVSMNDDSSEGMVTTRLQACSWSELANVGWSFASHGSCKSAQAEMLLLGLAREAGHRLRSGGDATKKILTRDIAQILWSLGTLQADNFRLAEDLVYFVEALTGYLRLGCRSASFGRGRPLRRWSCPDLVQTALSLAHARIDELPLLRAVYEECNYRLMEGIQEPSLRGEERRSFQAWEVSILLWAQARLYLRAPQGLEFEEFASDAPKFILKALAPDNSLPDIGIGPQEQANIAWSLTVLEEHQSPEAVYLLDRIFQEAAKACEDNHVIQLEHAHQLWQAYFLLEEESPDAVDGVPLWFVDYLRDKWKVEKARDKLSSARHRSLSQTLHLMGVDHYNEHDEDIDVAIVIKKDASWSHETDDGNEVTQRVSLAVEFDGPNHFTREQESSGIRKPPQPRALGHTVLKYRLLKKQGWSVVRVPYYEFDKIPFWASMVSLSRKSPIRKFVLFDRYY